LLTLDVASILGAAAIVTGDCVVVVGDVDVGLLANRWIEAGIHPSANPTQQTTTISLSSIDMNALESKYLL
jgi:hypothetical protein